MTGGETECVREKRERVDVGMRERGREEERARVLPAQSDQCFGVLAMWITAPTVY